MRKTQACHCDKVKSPSKICSTFVGHIAQNGEALHPPQNGQGRAGERETASSCSESQITCGKPRAAAGGLVVAQLVRNEGKRRIPANPQPSAWRRVRPYRRRSHRGRPRKRTPENTAVFSGEPRLIAKAGPPACFHARAARSSPCACLSTVAAPERLRQKSTKRPGSGRTR
jgi:hypothetical protein